MLFALLTKPEQPLKNAAVPTATADSSKPSRRMPLTFWRNSSVQFREFIWPPLIETPLRFIGKTVRTRARTRIPFALIAFLRLGQLGLDWGGPAEAEIAFCWVPNFPRRIEKDREADYWFAGQF